MKFQNLIIVLLSFTYLTCNGSNNTGLNIDREYAKHTYYTEGENPIKTNLVGTISQFCPVGVICDTSFNYHAYSGIIDSLHIYFSFKPQWLKQRTFQGVIENFDYLYFSLHLPYRDNDSVFYSYNLNAVWGDTVDSPSIYSCITGYANDTLYGVVKVKFQYLTKIKHSRDPGCISGDIMGICSEILDEPKEYIIQYKIKLEE